MDEKWGGAFQAPPHFFSRGCQLNEKKVLPPGGSIILRMYPLAWSDKAVGQVFHQGVGGPALRWSLVSAKDIDRLSALGHSLNH